MTTAATGSAGLRRIKMTNITIPSRITTSVQDLGALQAAQLLPDPAAPTPSVIIVGDVTSVPDIPGFTAIPPRVYSSAAQINAIRSAATNTAKAFGLNETFVADTASIEQMTMVQQAIRVLPTVTVTQVIIPQ